jgi:hypothetical protein
VIYRCWCPDRDETEADAYRIAAADRGHAAESYARSKWRDIDPFDDIVVHVRDEAGLVSECHVEVRAEPVFRTYIAKAVQR